MTKEHDEQIADEWHERKSSLMEAVLGPEHDELMHALIPFALGGGLALHYYPNGISGTAIATKELSGYPDQGPCNHLFAAYELVIFTRRPIELEHAKDKSTPFGQIHANLYMILNSIAMYSSQAIINPRDTAEIPENEEGTNSRCVIFDAYGADSSTKTEFGLLAVIEVFAAEMQYAQEKGGARLLAKLKQHGHYPYSDLDRAPVV